MHEGARRRARLDHAQRSLLGRLRLLHRKLRHRPEPARARVRRHRQQGRAPGRFGQPLHRLHELPRQAGPEGRRHGGRHRRRPGHFGREERPVQGHQDARPARDGRARDRPGRHLLKRRRPARLRTAFRRACGASRHRGQHGRLRCGPSGARPLRAGRRPRGRQRGRSRVDPVHPRPARRPASHPQDPALQGLQQPLPAHDQRLRQGRGHRQAPPLHHGQPLREGPGRHGEEREEGAQPLRVEEPSPLRLRAARRRPGDPRHRGHAPRAQHVRKLPLLVHLLHQAGLPRGAFGPVDQEDLRGRHRVDSVRKRVLPGQDEPRPHHEPARQASRLHLDALRQVGA